MKLRARNIVTPDHGGDGAAVVGGGDDHIRLRGFQFVGMHEIGVQTLVAGGDARQQRMGHAQVEGVPAHMRHLEAGIIGRDGLNVPGDPVESCGHLMLEAPGRQQLHAHANAQKGFAARQHRLAHGFDHAGDGVEAAPAIGEGAHARQHHPVGLAHEVGVAGEDDRQIEPRLGGGGFEGLLRGMKIAGAVIDDGDAHISLRRPEKARCRAGRWRACRGEPQDGRAAPPRSAAAGPGFRPLRRSAHSPHPPF